MHIPNFAVTYDHVNLENREDMYLGVMSQNYTICEKLFFSLRISINITNLHLKMIQYKAVLGIVLSPNELINDKTNYRPYKSFIGIILKSI